MPEVSLNSSKSIDTSKDSIVIVNLIEDKPGGRSLDVTGITEEVLLAGRPIISEDATGAFKPLPISGGNYASVPANHTVEGILVASVQTSKAFASILVRGTVNEKAAEDAQGLPAYTTAVKDALQPLIRFIED